MHLMSVRILIASCLVLIVMAAPLFAQEAAAPQAAASALPLNTRICIIDKTKAVDGQSFQSCDAVPDNNALLAKGFMIARIDRGTIKSRQPIWAHGLCRYIDNRSPTQDVLVPFGTEEEWKTFNQFVPGIMKVAGCCAPRAISLRDIPEPTTPCIGRWNLQQVVTSNSVSQAGSTAEQVVDEKMKLGGGGELVSTAGTALLFPIARDDDNTTYSVDGAREFAARWSCDNDEGNAGVLIPSAEGEESASHSDVLYVSFTLNCTREQWTPVILQTFCVASETQRAYSCEAAGYPAGTAGDILMYEKTLCPKGTTTRSLIKDSCEGERVGVPAAETQASPVEAAVDVPPAVEGQAPVEATPASTAKGRVNKEEKRTPR